MYKELFICMFILIIIIGLNIITQNYTKESIKTIEDNLENLKELLSISDVNKEEVETEVDNLMEKWREKYNILAYYIEHDELEKAETELTSIKSNIEVEQYEEGIIDLDRCIFILRHIKDKFRLEVKNIF